MFEAEILPSKGLGTFILGNSLHDILTRCKARPEIFPKLELVYSASEPITAPVIIVLPANGLRLRFDGPDQRLRLIEVLDFSLSHLTYKDQDLIKGGLTAAERSSNTLGPSFRYVYRRLFGISFPGEYVPPVSRDASGKGTYILSYPGIAFNFPLEHSAWSPKVDFVDLLLSSATSCATSLAIFDGESWAKSRGSLYTKQPPFPRSSVLALRGKDAGPDEIEKIVIHDQGRLELIRRSSPPFWINLNDTTPQELVSELGPPDAIYRKNDRRMAIHRKQSVGSKDRSEPRSLSPPIFDDSTDTDESSATAATTDDSELDDDMFDDPAVITSPECFYNYFHHGFDIFISHASARSPPWPKTTPEKQFVPSSGSLAATKFILHGNIPGSYPFNRHRRSRWVIDVPQEAPDASDHLVLDSEIPFPGISHHLKKIWKTFYLNAEEEVSSQRGMVLNRGWGNSPGSSCELLGGWEDSELAATSAGHGLGNTELFGFPGIIFEVLKNNTVSCLTVY